jgi:ABC-type lipoprotein release transport system permease subunit
MFTYVFYISAIIGIAIINPSLYHHLDIIMKLYVGLFLFIRFNPFRGEIKFTKLDREISFNAGVFILSMLLVNSAFASYIPARVHFE